jgi:hypothetical protein
MNPIRSAFTLLVVAGVVGGSLLAANASAAVLSGDEHGDAVASAARTCAHKTASDPDIHGDCVASFARMNHGHTASAPSTAEPEKGGKADDSHGDAVSSAAHDGGTSGDRDAHGEAVSSVAKSHSHH